MDWRISGNVIRVLYSTVFMRDLVEIRRNVVEANSENHISKAVDNFEVLYDDDIWYK